MSSLTTKRSTMTLYSGLDDIYSHQVRIVLAEKGVNYDTITIQDGKHLEDLAEVNPYQSVPTLIDRDLALFTAPIIMEYLDERFPHPPLLPVYPVARGRSRLMMYRVEKDWYTLFNQIQVGDKKSAERARGELLDSLLSVVPVFAELPFFMSEEFSLVDCYVAPLLWRLPQLGIELPPQAKDIAAYAKRIFDRDSFKSSLTDTEREMKK